MPENNNERTTMVTLLTLLIVTISAVIFGFGAVFFKLLNAIAL